MRRPDNVGLEEFNIVVPGITLFVETKAAIRPAVVPKRIMVMVIISYLLFCV